MFARRMQQWLVACLIAWPAVGAAADGDRAVTNNDLVAQMRAVWTKTILDTYDATADADAAWHADARRFIENYITLLSSIYTTSLELPPLEGVERMGRELLAAGCDEPIIHVLYGRVLFGQGMIGEAMPYLRSGYERCRGTANLQLLTGTTAMRLAQGMTALGQGGDQVEQYYAEAVTAIAQAAGNTMYVEDEQSALLEIIGRYCSNDLPAENGDELVAQCVAQEHSRRWLCMMLAGLRRLEVARASGYSPPQMSSSRAMVPRIAVGQYVQSGENGEKSAIEAERLLTAAWELRPERPQAAAAMIRLETYTESGSAEPWFDRAVEAQADYGPAHYAYIWHILRSDNWNMDELLRRYGRRCLAGNYETFEPSYYFTAMTFAAHNEDEYYGRYGRSPRSYLVGPDASAGFKKMLSGYGRAELSGELLRYVSLMGAAVSCLSRDWQQAREYLDAVDDLPGHIGRAEWFFRQVDLDANVGIAQAYAETGPAADALAAARAEYKQRNYDDALAILTDAAEVHRDDYWTTAYLHHSIRHTLMKRDLAAGEWVDITPDVALAGWQTVRGQAWVDPQGRVVCLLDEEHPAEWSMLISARRLSFGDAYELRSRVAFAGSDGSNMSAGLVLGRHQGEYGLKQCILALCGAGEGTITLREMSNGQVHHSSLEIEETNTIYAQVWKQNVKVFANERPAISASVVDEMPSGRSASRARIGICCAGSAGPAATFDDIQVRLLGSLPGKGEFDRDYSDRFRISAYSPAYGDGPAEPPPPAPVPAGPEDADDRASADDTAAVTAAETKDVVTIELDSGAFYDVAAEDLSALTALVNETLAAEGPAAAIERLEELLEDETLSEGVRQLAQQFVDNIKQARDDYQPDEQPVQAEPAEDGDSPADGSAETDQPAPDDEDAPTDPPAAEDDPPADEEDTEGASNEEAESPADAPGDDDEAPADQPTDDAGQSADDEDDQDAEADVNERLAVIARRRALIARLQAINQAATAYQEDHVPMAADWAEGLNIYFEAPGEPADGDAEAVDLTDESPGVVEPVVPAVDDSLFRTELVGREGGEAFEDTLTGPGYLVGVRLRFIDGGEINSIQPIYRTPGGRRYGGRAGLGVGRAVLVVARDGYAVGAVTGGEDRPGGAQFVFMRVTPDGRLDPADSYHSQPYGPGALGLEVTTDGRLPVGLAGRMGDTLQAVGLVATDEGDLAGVDMPTGDLGPVVAPAPPAPPARAQAEPPPADDPQATDYAPDAPAALDPAVQAALGEVIEFNGHWYRAFYTMVTWHEAKARCEALGGHLIYINDAQENEFAKWFVPLGRPVMWIGATDEAERGKWFWLDGSAVDYSDWGPNEPNVEGNEHAAAMVRTDDVSGWNNLPAATELIFLCEWDHDPTAPADQDDPPQQEDDGE